MTNNMIDKLAVCVVKTDSIDYVVRKLADHSKSVVHQGIALVLDSNGRLEGVVTDGDIRRAYSKDITFDNFISKIMTSNPISVTSGISEPELSDLIKKKLRERGRGEADFVRHLPVLDELDRVADIIDFFDYVKSKNGSKKRVKIYGMGYVGLTLAVALSNRSHFVTGVDIDADVVDSLNRGEPLIYERGLKTALNLCLDHNNLKFTTSSGQSSDHDVFIIAVGTPLNKDRTVSFDALEQVVKNIGSELKIGGQVMLRSTVPVGTTRRRIIPLLEKYSRLTAGRDFSVTFAPERTVEGNALQELVTLPQILGGLTLSCITHASDFWSSLSSSIVRVDDLESAELVKLANNTFRDVSFAFANELALLADQYNVNAFKLIKAANDGYPRNNIPSPSPGVGGYCLTKDPLLFSATSDGPRKDAAIGLTSRIINERAGRYPIKVIEAHASEIKLKLESMDILIVGVAFKGIPDTKDVRGSTAIQIADSLKDRVRSIWALDAVIEDSELKSLGFLVPRSLSDIVEKVDAILLLNNHPNNISPDLYAPSKKHKLIFDGWHQLDGDEIKKISGLRYATLGFIEPL